MKDESRRRRAEIALTLSTIVLALYPAVMCLVIWLGAAGQDTQGGGGFTRELAGKCLIPEGVLLGIWLLIRAVCLGLKVKASCRKPLISSEERAAIRRKSRWDISQKKVNILRILILAMAVLLIAAGIANGGMYDVLVKAVNICTECIGLG